MIEYLELRRGVRVFIFMFEFKVDLCPKFTPSPKFISLFHHQFVLVLWNFFNKEKKKFCDDKLIIITRRRRGGSDT